MRVLLLPLLVLLQANVAAAAEFSIVSYDSQDQTVRESSAHNFGNPFIKMDGEIVVGDKEKLVAKAKILNSNGFPLVLRLNSPGGSVSEALEIANFVRSRVQTHYIHQTIAATRQTEAR